MIKIAFIITGLSRGGAERMLIKLLKSMDRTRYTPAVFCLTDNLTLSPELEAIGVSVHHYRLNSPLYLGYHLIKFIRDCRAFSPDILQGWMYHGNILAWIVRRFCQAKLIFGIRATLYGFKLEKPQTRLMIRLGGILSKFADRIIYVSQIAREHHEAIGYAPHHACVLANGFELDKFKPNDTYRQDYRLRMGVMDHEILIGYFARFHKIKGHLDLIEAFSQVHRRFPHTKLALAGLSLDESNIMIQEALRHFKLTNHVLLLGELSTPERILPTLDIFASPSHQEGFPNVVGEAMACQIPCVVTDVGDSALCVGDTGIVVPAMAPDQLAQGLCQMIQDPNRVALGVRARERIETEFALSAIVKKYEKVYDSIVTEIP